MGMKLGLPLERINVGSGGVREWVAEEVVWV
jgi:hypothetical protein